MGEPWWGEMVEVTLGDWGHGGAAVRGRQCKKGDWFVGKAVSGSSHTSLGSQGERQDCKL